MDVIQIVFEKKWLKKVFVSKLIRPKKWFEKVKKYQSRMIPWIRNNNEMGNNSKLF